MNHEQGNAERGAREISKERNTLRWVWGCPRLSFCSTWPQTGDVEQKERRGSTPESGLRIWFSVLGFMVWGRLWFRVVQVLRLFR